MNKTPGVLFLIMVICSACMTSPPVDGSLRCGPKLENQDVLIIDGRDSYATGGESAMLEFARKQGGEYSLLTDQPIEVDSRVFVSRDHPTIDSKMAEGLLQAGAEKGCDMVILRETFRVGSTQSGRLVRIRFHLADRK